MDRQTQETNRSDEVPAGKKKDELYELIEGIEVAMMTTRRANGQLVSRPMQTQKHTGIADLWFVTSDETHKLDELETDPQVNLAYYKSSSREWVSVSGTATLSRDRTMIRELYDESWRVWLTGEGGPRDGSPEDPRIVLILVRAESVMYMKQNQSKPRLLFELAKGYVTGKAPKAGDLREISESEIR
jgi:general stress protein 26